MRRLGLSFLNLVVNVLIFIIKRFAFKVAKIINE